MILASEPSMLPWFLPTAAGPPNWATGQSLCIANTFGSIGFIVNQKPRAALGHVSAHDRIPDGYR